MNRINFFFRQAVLAVINCLLLFSPAYAQWMPGQYAATGLPAGSIYGVIQTLMLWLLAIFGFIAIIGFVISGIMYLVAAGDEERQKRAKKALYYSIIGVIVGLVGLIVLIAVTNLLSAWDTQF